jgi:hypothetical protein
LYGSTAEKVIWILKFDYQYASQRNKGMMTTLSKLTLHQDQLSLLSNFSEQFSVTVNDFLLLNQQQGYTETPFQLSLLLEAWLHKLEEQKGIVFPP